VLHAGWDFPKTQKKEEERNAGIKLDIPSPCSWAKRRMAHNGTITYRAITINLMRSATSLKVMAGNLLDEDSLANL